MKIDRRTALGLLGAGAASPASVAAQPAATGARFTHGVASGDPAADGIVLWTRALPASGDARVRLRYSIVDARGAAVKTGSVDAVAARDHTAKVEVDGLRPGTDYRYTFEAADGTRSVEGRFRTLPRGRAQDVVLAVASCQLYGGGLFNAFDAMARLPRVDAIVHLGDYIYEYGAGGYGAATEKRLGRVPDPPHEIVTLSDYRRRHAQYRSDPDLQAAHARAAFICVWDDHEIANDCWVAGAENHDPDQGEGDWRTRKAAALKAYHEWMPIRTPRTGGLDSIYRKFEFGDLATLLMTETRLLGRAEQAAFKGEAVGPEQVRAVLAELARPTREMLGATQARWLEAQLTASVASGKPWQIIGNQLVVARVAGPDLEASMGKGPFAAAIAKLPPAIGKRVVAAMPAYRAGVPMNLDAWDGYPHARERLYASFARAGSRPIVLSGDSHAFWANSLSDDRGRLAAHEFGTSGITSPSWGDALPGFDIGAAIAAANDEVLFSDQKRKGFVLLTLTREDARADFHDVSTILAKPFQSGAFKRFRIGSAERVLREA